MKYQVGDLICRKYILHKINIVFEVIETNELQYKLRNIHTNQECWDYACIVESSQNAYCIYKLVTDEDKLELL